MKNLKRTLSLVLAVALCFSLLTMGASAKVYKDESSVTYKEAVKWISALGVMGGELNDDGTYSLRPTDPITRAEFAKLVCTLMNGGVAPNLGAAASTSFTDTQGHWAAAYIEFLVSLGYISGYGDGTFGPNDTITGQQASKILLTVLGYNSTYEKLTGSTWAYKTDALASTNGLYSGLKSFSSTNLLKREEAAQMIYNALDAKMVIYGDAGVAGLNITRGSTLLKQYFPKINKVEGVVVSNGYGSILEGGAATDGKTYIISTKYLDATGKKLNDDITSSTEEIAGTSDALIVDVSTTSEMLGESVVLAFIADDPTDYDTSVELKGNVDLFGDIAVSSKNKTYSTTSGGKIKEATIGSQLDVLKSSGVLSTYKTKVLFNYSLLNKYQASNVLSTDTSANFDYFLAGTTWSTQFVDYNGDGTVDFVKVYTGTPYKVIYVTSGGTVTLKDLTTGQNVQTTFDATKFINKADDKAATVKKDDVFLGYIDNTNAKVYVSPATSFTGEVTGVNASSTGPTTVYANGGILGNTSIQNSTRTGAGTDADPYVYCTSMTTLTYSINIDGTKYSLHDALMGGDGCGKGAEDKLTGWTSYNYNPDTGVYSDSSALVALGTTATFYKDDLGAIVYIDEEATEAATNIKFGLVTFVDSAYNFGADGTYIKLVGDDGIESVKLVSELYNVADAEFQGTDETGNSIPTNYSGIIAYTVKADGSLKAVLMDSISGTVASTLSIEKGTPKIIVGTSGTNYYGSYILSSTSKFINATDNLSYTGYAVVPDTTYPTTSKLYIVTLANTYAAQKILNGAAPTDASGLVSYMFYTGADTTAGDDTYFYVPNAASYSSSYASDGTTLVKTYRAFVNGVLRTDFAVVEDFPATKKLYKISKYDSDGKTVKDITQVASLAVGTADSSAITALTKSVLTQATGSYILTSTTVYINVTASTNFELVDYDFLSTGMKVYVNFDPETFEALEVYYTK